ncbi:MAG: eukaryotic-like serine/threonine-protein kinase, partial [Microbacteriaceae bacterium]|nr:eukaryotic-like serine/threonine-protein kinase [Microbacteriaceae bacterium]
MRQNRPEPGDLIGERYRLLSPLGSGGMAEVFRAHDERLDRDVAVKVFRADLADAVDPQRTTRETHLLAGMSHPTVVAVLDASDDTTALPYLVMELVEGRDLGGMLADGALPPDFARRIVADVADALRLLHSRSVVHRDVKPANILVLGDAETDRTGVTAKLTDFGIARMVDGTRLTTSDSILGTAAYLSPEQVRGGGVGPASDVYSLALVLIECLSGGRAFPGPATEAAVARLTRPPALPQNASPKLAALLSRMTARDPAARPPAGEIVEALRGELVGAMTAPESLSTAPVPVLPMAAAAAAVLAEPAVAGGAAAAPAPAREGPAAVRVPPVAPEVEDRPRRRHPLLPAGLGVLCLAVLAGLG